MLRFRWMSVMAMARAGALLAVLSAATLVCAQGDAAAPPGVTPETSANAAAEVPAAFDSPAATLRTFITAMAKSPPDLDRAAMCLDASKEVAEAVPDLSLKLYRCINRIEFVDFEHDATIPDAAALARRSEPLMRWTFFPRSTINQRFSRTREIRDRAPDAEIALVHQADGTWKFSAATVAGIEDLYARIGDLPPVDESLATEYRTAAEVIEGFWPAYFVNHAFLSVKYWQWISLLALIFIGVVLDFVVRLVLIVISRRLIARRGGRAKDATLRKTVRPFGLAAAAVFWLMLFVINLLGLPSTALAVLVPAVKFFAILALVWAAYRVTDLIAEVFTSKAERTDTKFDDLLIPLVRKTVKIFITVFGLIYLADSLSIPLAPLLTGLGIGGAGFAFAAKDTLEHFFGSLTVIADRPFQVGDWVKIGDAEGTVEEVGFRSTRVRTFYNSLLSIPNGNLVRAVVDNFGMRKYRRWTTHLNLTYDTPPEKIEAFCEGVRELIRLHPYTRKDYYQVWMHQFGAHSLDVLVYVFWEAPDWQTELRERHRLILDVLRLADRLGVEFAFPTQTLHVFKEAGDGEHRPADLPPREVELKAQREGRKVVRELTANAGWREGKPGPYVFHGAGSGSADDDDDETQIESKVGGDAG